MSESRTSRRRSRSVRSRVAPGLAVLGGGLLGSGVRAVVSAALPASPGRFPMSTLVVNLVGSLLLGVYLSRRQTSVSGRWSLQFWAIGALGSLTTFSTFSVDVVKLVHNGAAMTAVVYVVVSAVGGLMAALVGDRVGSLSA